ncbi:HERV-H LTR-associating protein 1 isoform X3 [Rhineura floridana]|uniref:HERV-H LTR-associating protein 1 isoform X3 n=1 Tax=Rhineura floridana TaxID=261503 RepID=UPI002AC84665|nr:HERV-H LTR-associating protein 1 isoform X3 [Rhineura floridana]
MPWFPLCGAVNLSLGFLCLLFVSSFAASAKEENKKQERVVVLATAELPAKSVDLAAVNLTELVNGMLNMALKGSKTFFSLLSITSYSSYALHKVSIVIYNISNLKTIDPSKFPTRYCYCLNNRTNDLTDFTALLVDIVGNSTNYLTEIFKSTSIVSVSQGNDTDCIYICVMSGRTGRNLSDLWEAIEKTPVINYTFSGNMSDLLDLDLIHPGLIPVRQDADKVPGDAAKDTWTFKTTKMPAWSQTGALRGKEMLLTQHPIMLRTVSLKGSEAPSAEVPLWLQTDASRGYEVSSTKTASARPPPTPLKSYASLSEALSALTTGVPVLLASSSTKGQDALKTHPPSSEPYILLTRPSSSKRTKRPHQILTGNVPLPALSLPPPQRPGILVKVHSRCPLAIKKETSMITPSVTVQKIHPCVLELCKFYQQCLCSRDRRYSRDEAIR